MKKCLLICIIPAFCAQRELGFFCITYLILLVIINIRDWRNSQK